MNKVVSIIVVLLVALLVVMIFVLGDGNNRSAENSTLRSGVTEETDLSTFVSCLKSNEAIFYGAWWCPHCDEQKETFGKYEKNLVEEEVYFECSEASRETKEACTTQNIVSYPTWKFNIEGNPENQLVCRGTVSLAALSVASSCPLESTTVKGVLSDYSKQSGQNINTARKYVDFIKESGREITLDEVTVERLVNDNEIARCVVEPRT